MSMALPTKVKLREVAPRDGLQSLNRVLPMETKLELIRGAISAGLGEVEVTSFVSPRLLPQLADAPQVMEAMHTDPDFGNGVVRAVLVPTVRQAERAVEAGADDIVVFLSASEEHNQANVKCSVAESLEEVRAVLEVGRNADTPVTVAIAVSFGCPYSGAISQDRVFEIVERVRDQGASSMIFGDTTGVAVPPQVENFVRSYRERFCDLPYSLHFHNNRGLAMTNLYAALGAGATTFDTAIGGIGGCPTVPQAAGNLATEDVVQLLDRLGIETGVNLGALIEAAKRLEEVIGVPLPGQVMKSGAVEEPALEAAVMLPA